MIEQYDREHSCLVLGRYTADSRDTAVLPVSVALREFHPYWSLISFRDK